VIVFACFYIEASLNHIIKELGVTEEMENFFRNRPGLQNKLAWFYNRYLAKVKATNQKELNIIYPYLEERFPRFSKLKDFRNEIAHGVIDKSITNIEDAEDLRHKAKKIVEDLQDIALLNGVKIARKITYGMAISGDEVTVS
jgi:methionine synthase II (cobalamin-independent)